MPRRFAAIGGSDLNYEAATFSPCRKYRYTLWRKWDDDWQTNFCMFIGLNPSTADEVQDDPTIRRCIGFAKNWGYSALCMTNIFAYRATDPKDMKSAEDPIGVDNDHYLIECATKARCVIAAWGNHGVFKNRSNQVSSMISMISPLLCLRVTASGMPSHPLYLPQTLEPIPFFNKEEPCPDDSPRSAPEI